MNITWLTQGSFLMESAEARILIDPYMSDFLATAQSLERLVDFPLALEDIKPDLFLCTHDHLDHFDPETVSNIASFYPDCVFAGPISCYNHFLKMGIAESRINLLEMGKSFTFNDVTITPITAFHSDPESVGYIIAENGFKTYLTGDSQYSAELVNDLTTGCDLVLTCINGKLGNMNDTEAAQMVKAIKPKHALPMHYGLFAENTADPEFFINECKGADINSFAMQPGTTFTLEK